MKGVFFSACSGVFTIIFLLSNIDFLQQLITTHPKLQLGNSALAKFVNKNPAASSASSSRHKSSSFRAQKIDVLHSFFNVCIEDAASYTLRNESSGSLPSERHVIVIYDQTTLRVGQTELTVSTSSWTKEFDNMFTVILKNTSAPHRILPHTAFMIVPTHMYNIHHFWEDFYVSIYSTMKMTNRLGRESNNYILFRRPHVGFSNGTSCHNDFCKILHTLPTSDFQGIYDNLPTNTCFHSAVFGPTVFGDAKIAAREAVDHLIKELNLTYLYLPQTAPRFVTIIQRKYRRIVNTDEMVEAAQNESFSHVRVVNFESLTVREQIIIAATSEVLVGLQGAELQWLIAMRPNSTLIEIAWPQKHWPYYYHDFVWKYDLQYMKLNASEVYLNWRSYEAVYRPFNQTLTEKMEFRMLRTKPLNIHRLNVWKYADALVDIEGFRKLLKLVITRVAKEKKKKEKF